MDLIFPQFEGHAGLRYGFSKRSAGSMNRRHEVKNRQDYFRQIGIDPFQTATADLVHGNTPLAVDEAAGGQMISGADALVTDRRGLFLSATSADCFLIYLFDPKRRAIGIAHAGWRGALAGLIANTVDLMSTRYGSAAPDILAGVGPGIRDCHFEISSFDIIKYQAYPEAIIKRSGKTFIDLPLIINRQLLTAGISAGHITDSGRCTYCLADEYFSYRRDKPERVQPMVGYIGVTSR